MITWTGTCLASTWQAHELQHQLSVNLHDCSMSLMGPRDLQLLGSYVVVAEAWPSLAIQRGAVALSGSLSDSLGRPPVNAMLVLHRWSDVAVSTPPQSAFAGDDDAAAPAPAPSPKPPLTPSQPSESSASSAVTHSVSGAAASPEAAHMAGNGTDQAPHKVTLRLLGTVSERVEPGGGSTAKTPLKAAAARATQLSQHAAADVLGSKAKGASKPADQVLSQGGPRQKRLLGAVSDNARELCALI